MGSSRSTWTFRDAPPPSFVSLKALAPAVDPVPVAPTASEPHVPNRVAARKAPPATAPASTGASTPPSTATIGGPQPTVPAPPPSAVPRTTTNDSPIVR